MNVRFFLTLIFLFSVIICSDASSDKSEKLSGWQAGVAAVDITPSLPMWMAGYGSRNRPGDSVALPLKSKAVALRDDKGRVMVIVTLDILGVPRVLRKKIEERIGLKYGIGPSQLLMSYSHTHSGPEVRSVETLLGKIDPVRTGMVTGYCKELEDKIIGVIGKAFSELKPANLSYGSARAGFAMNRRADYSLPKDDFRFGKQPDSKGPVDNDVPVLSITDANGKILAVLFGYACHATTLGDYAFHGDYPGYAQKFIEESHHEAVAMFIAGCGADQNPHPRRDMIPGISGYDLVKIHGRTLAVAVEAALSSNPEPLKAEIESVIDVVAIDYLPAPGREELRSQATSTEKSVSDNAKVLLEILERDGKLPSYYPYPVQVIRFGNDLTLVALASEVVVDYSLRLKKELQGRSVWIAAYSNDFLGYIPSRRVWTEGGYEGGTSLVFTRETLYRGAVHPNKWDPVIEQKIVAKVHELNNRLNDKELVSGNTGEKQ